MSKSLRLNGREIALNMFPDTLEAVGASRGVTVLTTDTGTWASKSSGQVKGGDDGCMPTSLGYF